VEIKKDKIKKENENYLTIMISTFLHLVDLHRENKKKITAHNQNTIDPHKPFQNKRTC
jgi:hypothetical protein